MHYRRWKLYGDPGEAGHRSFSPDTPPAERVAVGSDVDHLTGCWVWQRALTSDGYGSLRIGDGSNLAHRVSYEAFVGPIPDGLELDHLCRNRACVNPWHLEPVTARINVRRGEGPTAHHARKTHCKYGHPFDAENTYRNPRGARACKTCRRRIDRKRRQKERVWQP